MNQDIAVIKTRGHDERKNDNNKKGNVRQK